MRANSLFCKGIWSFIPILFLPILLLIPLLYSQWDDIERTVKSNTQAALTAEYKWAEVETFRRGRDVLLSGVAPSAQAIKGAKVSALGSEGVRRVDFVGSIASDSKRSAEPIAQSVQIEEPQSQPEEPAAIAQDDVSEQIMSEQVVAQSCQVTVTSLLEDSKVLFASGSANIDTSSDGLLRKIADALLNCPNINFEVAGHTDSTGSDEVNRIISGSRAKAVVSRLVELGLDNQRFIAVGYGADQPIADNETVQGRAKNRRIEFKATN